MQTRRRQNGGVKVHPSLAKKPKKSMEKTKRTKKSYKLKYHTTALKTLKRKIKKRVTDDSPQALLKGFRLSTEFLRKILKRYERIFHNANATKLSNYSIFLSILATSLFTVARKNEDLIDAEKNPHVLNEEIAVLEPHEYVERFLDFIEEEDIAKELKEAAAEYFAKELRSPKRMMTGNVENDLEELEEEYLELSHFIQDVNTAVAETIRNYSKVLKESKALNNNVNLNELILGLTEVKIGANEPNKNILELDDLLTRLLL